MFPDQEITAPLKVMNPRFAFNTNFEQNGIVDATWTGFDYMGPKDLAYARQPGHHNCRTHSKIHIQFPGTFPKQVRGEKLRLNVFETALLRGKRGMEVNGVVRRLGEHRRATAFMAST